MAAITKVQMHHGGGNNSSEAPRTGLTMAFDLACLRQEENQYLSIPSEKLLDLSEEVQRLLGWGSGANLMGYVERGGQMIDARVFSSKMVPSNSRLPADPRSCTSLTIRNPTRTVVSGFRIEKRSVAWPSACRAWTCGWSSRCGKAGDFGPRRSDLWRESSRCPRSVVAGTRTRHPARSWVVELAPATSLPAFLSAKGALGAPTLHDRVGAVERRQRRAHNTDDPLSVRGQHHAGPRICNHKQYDRYERRFALFDTK